MTNESDLEFVGKVRRAFNKRGIVWQPFVARDSAMAFATVSKDFANMNMDVIDAAICVLGAHSPYEFALKSDLHEACLACAVFFDEIT